MAAGIVADVSTFHGQMRCEALRPRVSELLAWPGVPGAPAVRVVADRFRNGYTEQLIEYQNAEGETIPAFLLMPDRDGPLPAVVVHHQHNGERHLGKSEVVGLAGEPLQGFAPALARNGIVVLAPDAVCFEDRRRGATGTDRHPGDDLQHYNEMAYRLVAGKLLMSLVVADSALALSVLCAQPEVDPQRVGMLGHSMGGHTTLFTAALDERVRFAGISGALSGYHARIKAGVGIELGQVIPGIMDVTDFDGLLALIAPRPVLIVSADQDPYSSDAPNVVHQAHLQYEREGVPALLTHHRYAGEHEITEERVSAILDWVLSTTVSQPQT